MYKIAIIQFPGTNCEYESFRVIKKAGLEPEFFRWNENQEKLRNYDGYFIPGGFSYEDRVRSGVIAAHDPLMEVVAEETAKGKPVIGICNGAQILVESGMIPGLNANHIGSSLAWNEKGYLNIWVHIKNEAELGRSVFNNYDKGHYFALPIAHGEGRYVIPDKLLKELQDNDQIIFRYCDESGDIKNEYPINPNGAVDNIAGICNPDGNVLALMPHPERTEEGMKLFESMRNFIETRNLHAGMARDKQIPNIKYETPELRLEKYVKSDTAMEFLVDLIITDNEAETLQAALIELGYGDIKVKRFTHFEVGLDKVDDKDKLAGELIKSGELLNTNKEIAFVDDKSELDSVATSLAERKSRRAEWHTILVRYQNDFDGEGRLHTLQNRLGFDQLKEIKKGTVWQIECSEEKWHKILASNILFNPYSQNAWLMNN